MDDSLIPIVLAIVAAIIGAVSQGKKKSLQLPKEPEGEQEFPQETESPIPEAEVILRKIMREITPEPIKPPAPKPAPLAETLIGDLSIPDELKRQRDLLMAVEGLQSIPGQNDFIHDEIHDDIASSQITDAEVEVAASSFEVAGVGTWDLRKAVVFSEILNRKKGM
ncbi:MAG: hypothetical protein U0T82_15205 [Bacteroidales bacterium]